MGFETPKHLSTLLRLYIYSLHGYFIEVTFTAIWDFVTIRDWKLAGMKLKLPDKIDK